jgi:hypothetical protein
LKKANAILSIISLALLSAHALYELSAYVLFYYNPFISALTGWLAGGAIAMHAVLSAINLFKFNDSKTVLYKRLNLGTIVQRVSAVIMVLLFPFHINTYDFLKINSHGAAFYLAETVYIVFYSALFTHIAVSFSRALISLGKLEDDRKRRSINKAVSIICAAAALITIIITIRTHIKMFGL